MTTKKQNARKRYKTKNEIPRTIFNAKIHPRESEVSAEVNGYFLKHWPFENDKAKQKFVAAGFPRVTCLYYPAAEDDRIALACRLLTLLFLVDGKYFNVLEDLSLEDGASYNERLICISRGDVDALPDRNVPVEWITYDLWEDMRACDRELADGVLEPTFTFMRAQTDKCRLGIKELGQYLEYREKDVGQALLCALMRFSMNLHISDEELASVREIEMNCAKHISVLNDIYSWEKEVSAASSGHHEGSALCSSVLVLSNQTKLDVTASKRILWVLCREWELVHEQLVKKRLASVEPCSSDLKAYMNGLKYQMSGNEAWSGKTPRYHSVYA
ncbi:aristolochene synthase [Pseudomassariella vexata]|uniref:Terpene synthase n=1 Tax=Pseudomassariella vexata TaxID=1141098 RepID=A0A1Y2E4J8_9PEZI|nr:aristolochene synthase [Pseudomassariella vexata]ORY66216.1 aristolochene synthase [Pseudomassariella vexata]